MDGEVSTVVAVRERWAFEVSSREHSEMVQGERTRWPRVDWIHESVSAVGAPSLVE
jgi:hypothetical protein